MEIVLFFVFVVWAVIVWASCSDNGPPDGVIEEIRSVCELAAVQCHYEESADITTEGEGRGRRMRVRYTGTVFIGIKASDIEITASGRTLSVRLPDATAISTQVTLRKVSYLSARDVVLADRPSEKDHRAAMVKAQEHMLARAYRDKQAFANAKNRTKDLINDRVARLEKSYTIEWKA